MPDKWAFLAPPAMNVDPLTGDQPDHRPDPERNRGLDDDIVLSVSSCQ
jgi:hypothetical protein